MSDVEEPAEPDMPPPLVRELAARQIEQNDALRFTVLGIVGDLTKWLLAILVTINGGGVIALLNLGAPPRGIALFAIAFFVFGICAAVSAAIFQLVNAAIIAARLGTLAQPTAIYSIKFAAWTVEAAGKGKPNLARIALGCIVGSLCCFFAGAVLAGIALL
jgi:hypothetical protein